MPKSFFTERDIEDMVRRGTTSLVLTDEIVLTELAYEKAERLGMKLIREHESRPTAPVRPYIASASAPRPVQAASNGTGTSETIKKRVRDTVIARLGSQVDPNLLDTIIDRVLKSTGIK
jgi:hypothetical protein